MDTHLSKEFISLLRTEEDVYEFVRGLEAVDKGLYKQDAVLLQLLSEKVSSRFFVPLQDLCKQFSLPSQTERVHSLLSTFITQVQQLPIAHLTLAFDPTPFLLQDISQWLREQVAEDIVLAVTIDKRIIGGLLLDYNGHYWDFSIRSSFDKLFSGGNLIYLARRENG